MSYSRKLCPCISIIVSLQLSDFVCIVNVLWFLQERKKVRNWVQFEEQVLCDIMQGNGIFVVFDISVMYSEVKNCVRNVYVATSAVAQFWSSSQEISKNRIYTSEFYNHVIAAISSGPLSWRWAIYIEAKETIIEYSCELYGSLIRPSIQTVLACLCYITWRNVKPPSL
jgi:hypothetical protein